jgi:hypothetical protein
MLAIVDLLSKYLEFNGSQIVRNGERLMKPILIGYFPIKTSKNFDSLKPFGVEEVCSISCCVSDAPEGWIDQWKHNEMWVFDSIEKAWSVVSEDQKRDFEIFAYWVFPEIVEVSKPEVLESKPFIIPNLPLNPWTLLLKN